MSDYIKITGLDRLLRKLDRLPEEMTRLLGASLEAGLRTLEPHFEYPPASEANRPRFGAYGPYYERGIGSAYKRLRDGDVTQYYNSERLSARWARRVSYGPYMVEATLANSASYGPFVHSAPEQARFHAERGWVTVEDALQKERAGIVRLIERTVGSILRRLGW